MSQGVGLRIEGTSEGCERKGGRAVVRGRMVGDAGSPEARPGLLPERLAGDASFRWAARGRVPNLPPQDLRVQTQKSDWG